VGLKTEQETLEKLKVERPKLEAAEAELEEGLKVHDLALEVVEKQKEAMVERWMIYDRTKLALDALKGEVDSFWAGDEDRCQKKYQTAVEELRSLSLKEWYQVRRSNPASSLARFFLLPVSFSCLFLSLARFFLLVWTCALLDGKSNTSCFIIICRSVNTSPRQWPSRSLWR
jgi:hypothetical protein